MDGQKWAYTRPTNVPRRYAPSVLSKGIHTANACASAGSSRGFVKFDIAPVAVVLVRAIMCRPRRKKRAEGGEETCQESATGSGVYVPVKDSRHAVLQPARHEKMRIIGISTALRHWVRSVRSLK